MCGIAGVLSTGINHDELTTAVSRMTAALAHRGPDDAGTWVDAVTGVALGHTRLSIIDLSAEGHQPMMSASGRFATVFNGEIYNFPALGRELEAAGHRFRGHSDTEVMLAAFEEWGVVEALPRLNGMFAFAVWDRKLQCLHLARDRGGEKPLYYGWAGKSLVFGSELKALQQHPDFCGSLNRSAIVLYLQKAYVPPPNSIWDSVRQLPPATSVTIAADEIGRWPEPRPYWSAREVALHAESFAGSETEAIEALDSILRNAVAMRMLSDVPLGAFLSGGIDSTTIVALMQAQSARPVRTFSIGFHDPQFNEAEAAAAVARHIGTDHMQLYLAPDDMLDVIGRLPDMYDEPFADSSQLPTHMVSVMARKYVTVALTGDAADEVFGGYVQHFFWASLWQRLKGFHGAPRALAGRLLCAVPQRTINKLVEIGSPCLPYILREVHRPGEKIHRIGELLASHTFDEWYGRIRAAWNQADDLVIGAGEGDACGQPQWPANVTRSMMLHDFLNYLPGDILVKVDRASMAVALETRVPFLDPDVYAFAARLPVSMLVNRWQGKLILRKLLYGYVPREIVDRPKRGFTVPLGKWISGPLRQWAEDLLSERRIRNDGILEPHRIRQIWKWHLLGRADYSMQLWPVLILQGWLEQCNRRLPLRDEPVRSADCGVFQS